MAYKIVKNGNIIDANSYFLKWNDRLQCLLMCSDNYAEFAVSSKSPKLYHDDWLRTCPNKNIQYENAKIITIENDEYEEILSQLNNEEEIPDIPEQSESEESLQNTEPESEPLTVMTVSEMRVKIILQLLQINMLTDCLLEMSEIIYA